MGKKTRVCPECGQRKRFGNAKRRCKDCRRANPGSQSNPPGSRRCKRSLESYANRAAALLEIGFFSYQEYLASGLWKGIRVRVYARDNGKCRICGEAAAAIHHDSYAVEVLRGANIDRLAAICNSCHEKLEFNEDGSKRYFGEVQLAYRRLIAGRKQQSNRPGEVKEDQRNRCERCGNFAKKGAQLCTPCRRRVVKMVERLGRECLVCGIWMKCKDCMEAAGVIQRGTGQWVRSTSGRWTE